MANTAQRGFRWVRSLDGGAEMPTPVRVRLASGLTPQIGGAGTYNLRVGDPIQQLSTGYHTVAVGSEGTQTGIFGIVVGFEPIYNSSTGRKEFVREFPGGGGVYGTNLSNMSYALVVPVGGQVFEVDWDQAATTVDTEAEQLALVGQNCDHKLVSGQTPDLNPLLDTAQIAVGAGGQWRILDISTQVGNDPTSTRSKMLVMCNWVQAGAVPATFQTPI